MAVFHDWSDTGVSSSSSWPAERLDTLEHTCSMAFHPVSVAAAVEVLEQSQPNHVEVDGHEHVNAVRRTHGQAHIQRVDPSSRRDCG